MADFAGFDEEMHASLENTFFSKDPRESVWEF